MAFDHNRDHCEFHSPPLFFVWMSFVSFCVFISWRFCANFSPNCFFAFCLSFQCLSSSFLIGVLLGSFEGREHKLRKCV